MSERKLMTAAEAYETPGTGLYRMRVEASRQRKLIDATLVPGSDQHARYWRYVVAAGRCYLSPDAWIAAGEPAGAREGS